MGYRTYITEAIICGSRADHTSDRSYLLFAREAGMLYATAKSVREERSKQRYALQEFSYVRATLVQGKSGWKIAGVEPLKDLYAEATTRERRTLLRNIVLLLRRVMHGETPHAHLFDSIVDALSSGGASEYAELEQILSLRILYALGYVAPTPEVSRILEEQVSEMLVQGLTTAECASARTAIEHALQESHL